MPSSLKKMVKASKGQLDPLTPLIDRYLLERTSEAPFSVPLIEHVRAGGRFTPSSCGDEKCMRAAVLQFMQTPKQQRRDPETELIFGVGNYTHLMCFNMFVHMEHVLGADVFKVESIEQLVAYPSLFLAGWLDVKVRINQRLYIVDFKTINDAGFTTLMQNRAPRRDHVGQLVRYLYSSKVPRGLLVYLNKNDQRVKVFAVDHKSNKDSWDATRRWIRRAITHLQKQTIPAKHRDCTGKETYMARSCGFSYMCHGGYRDEDIGAHAYTDKPSYDALWDQTTGRHLATAEEDR